MIMLARIPKVLSGLDPFPASEKSLENYVENQNLEHISVRMHLNSAENDVPIFDDDVVSWYFAFGAE